MVEEMAKILSIVIPAYNVEKYLVQCLDSFMVEEILDKIEVLIINDGSTDTTIDIATKYCNKFPQTFFLYNKENGGHGSGINYGIRYAKGKYFKVVDGDDWLNTTELQSFVKLLEEIDADIIAANYRCIQDGTGSIIADKKCTMQTEQYGKICNIEKGEITNVIKMHALTIKTSILQENNIVIDEKCFYVDAEYITYPIPYVKTVYFCDKYIYMYRLGRSGQSVDIKSMQKRRDQHMRVINSLLSYYKSCDKASLENKRYMAKCIAQIIENQFQIYISMGFTKGIYSEMKNWDRNLLAEYPDIYRATAKKSITLLRKTNYLMLLPGAIMYKIVRN